MPSESNDTSQEAKKARHARALKEFELASNFRRVFESKLDELSRSAREQGASAAFRLHEAEKDILLGINNMGILPGLGAGLVSLVVLRRVRATVMRRIREAHFDQQQRQQQQAWSNHPSPPPGTTPPPPPPSSNGVSQQLHVQNSPFQQSINQSASQFGSSSSFTGGGAGFGAPGGGGGGGPGAAGSGGGGSFIFSAAYSIVGWCVDLAGSFAVCVAVSLAYTDMTQVLQSLASLPLVSGPSQVSHHFCPAVQAEMKRLQEIAAAQEQQQELEGQPDKLPLRPEDVSIRDCLNSPQSPYLAALVDFERNCGRRQRYAEKLRQEQQTFRLDGSSTEGEEEKDAFLISIPSPGVPVTDDEEEESFE